MARPSVAVLSAWFGTLIDRFPYGQRPAVGAGYAMTVAAVAGGVLAGGMLAVWDALTAALPGAGSFVATFTQDSGTVLVAAVMTLFVAAPSAFALGIVVWWLLPASQSYRGVLGGFLTTVGTYVVTCGVFALLLLLSEPSDPLLTAASFVALLGILFLFLFGGTCVATVPVGVFAGYLYERS